MNGRVDPRSWAAPRPPALHRFVPITTWLPGYDYRRLLRFDVVAGATVWGLLVPEMIAYSGLAGLPPQAGLYTLLATLAAYAIFGTSRHVVVGRDVGSGGSPRLDRRRSRPEPRRLPGQLGRTGAVRAVACSCSPAFCRLGFIAQFLSRPVIGGFVFGLAIFVTVKQLPKLFGIEGGEGDTIHQFAHLIDAPRRHERRHARGRRGRARAAVRSRALRPEGAGRARRARGRDRRSAALSTSRSHGVAIVGEVPSGLPVGRRARHPEREHRGADRGRGRDAARDLQRVARRRAELRDQVRLRDRSEPGADRTRRCQRRFRVRRRPGRRRQPLPVGRQRGRRRPVGGVVARRGACSWS